MDVTQYYRMLPDEVYDALMSISNKLRLLNLQYVCETSLNEPSTYFLKNQGKLARPILVLLSNYIAGGTPDDVKDLALSVELVHIASLIHDDIIDGDSIRRGVPTVHIKYGGEYAILAGDVLLAKAIELASKFGYNIVKEISNTAMKMGAGEALDFECQSKKIIPSLSKYFKIVNYKTTSLIETSTIIGAKVMNANIKLLRSLRNYGRFLGWAFQIRDDIINFMGISDYKLKSGYNDIKVYRPNIVKVIAYNFNIDIKTALKKAIELNRKYIKRAIDAVKDIKNGGEILATYASWFRVNFNKLNY